MSASDFCYWLQGFFEMTNTKQLSEEQCRIVKEHLKLVFKKETPTFYAEERLCSYKPGPSC